MNDELTEEKAQEKEIKKDFRDCLYGKIDVSVESVDKFITVLIVLLVLSILFGAIL